MTKKITETKVLITNARLSYPHLFEPHGFDGQEPKYSASLIVSKDDKEGKEIINSAISAAFKAGVESGKLKASDKTKMKIALRDGDEEREEDPAYSGAYFINANSKRAPQVVGRYKDPKTGKVVELDEEEVYPGCYVNATVNFYPYSVSGNKGIAAGLGNIQKAGDGERLDGAASADEDFDFEEAEEVSMGGSEDSDDDWLS